MTTTVAVTHPSNAVSPDIFSDITVVPVLSVTYGADLTDPAASATFVTFDGTLTEAERSAVVARVIEQFSLINITRGSFTGTTDASGDVTIAHSASATPASAQHTPRTAGQYVTQSVTSTNIVVRCYTVTGVVLGSGVSVTLDWAAHL